MIKIRSIQSVNLINETYSCFTVIESNNEIVPIPAKVSEKIIGNHEQTTIESVLNYDEIDFLIRILEKEKKLMIPGNT